MLLLLELLALLLLLLIIHARTTIQKRWFELVFSFVQTVQCCPEMAGFKANSEIIEIFEISSHKTVLEPRKSNFQHEITSSTMVFFSKTFYLNLNQHKNLEGLIKNHAKILMYFELSYKLIRPTDWRLYFCRFLGP